MFQSTSQFNYPLNPVVQLLTTIVKGLKKKLETLRFNLIYTEAHKNRRLQKLPKQATFILLDKQYICGELTSKELQAWESQLMRK